MWFDSGAMPYAQWHYQGKEATPVAHERLEANFSNEESVSETYERGQRHDGHDQHEQRPDHLNATAAFLANDDFEGLMRYHIGRVFSEPDVADLAAAPEAEGRVAQAQHWGYKPIRWQSEGSEGALAMRPAHDLQQHV